MDSDLSRLRNAFLTFSIGLIAGISPFLFMQLLPALLNPGLHLEGVNYLAIILTGALVGIITSIIFATQFEKREPQDIFFYALGIPAILIATVSNMRWNKTSSGEAWAQESKEGPGMIFAQAGSFFVAIGEYSNEKAAWEDYRKYKDQRLRTELYSPKNLNVLETRKGVYALVYGRYSSQEQATKVFQLLRINDPGLNVRILKY